MYAIKYGGRCLSFHKIIENCHAKQRQLSTEKAENLDLYQLHIKTKLIAFTGSHLYSIRKNFIQSLQVIPIVIYKMKTCK